MSNDDEPSRRRKSPLGAETEESHPSYGMVGFSRVSIGGIGQSNAFFGSSLDNHMSCMRLRVSTGARRRTVGHHYYFERDRLIEVDLTAAQFAELLTTANVGSGVPCTIRFHDGKMVKSPPLAATSASKSQEEFEETSKDIASDAARLLRKMREAAEKKSVTKADIRELTKELEMVVQAIERNLPFALTTFREAVQDVVAEAKAEVDAFVSNAVVTAGVTAIAGQGFVPKNLLGTGSESSESSDG